MSAYLYTLKQFLTKSNRNCYIPDEKKYIFIVAQQLTAFHPNCILTVMDRGYFDETLPMHLHENSSCGVSLPVLTFDDPLANDERRLLVLSTFASI